MNRIFINGVGSISPQKTTDNSRFLEEPLSFEANRLTCIDPGYREFIPAEMIRRMGRIIKMGVAASKLCLQDAGDGNRSDGLTGFPENSRIPAAIITGTGLGCMEDTGKFLASMINNREEFLTPTSFIQSTHNTVAGQIALLLKCHSYNFTYVHRGISFESALIDAMTQMQLGEFSNVLVGGTDEITNEYFAITTRMGFWKQKPIQTINLLDDHQRGTVAGEGASFLFLENQKNDHTYAELKGVTTFMNPSSGMDVSLSLHELLSKFSMTVSDIDLVILGLNGDSRTDKPYHDLIKTDFPDAPVAYFKNLCGEYHTSSAFATWLGAMVLKKQTVPRVIRINHAPERLDNVLIYNHHLGDNHAFILLSRM